ncbi:MAG: C-terminal processing protease CtpA/Prc [Alteromonadaceae bacterium]|jgi:C-terminal processing protease CtpA/Prc
MIKNLIIILLVGLTSSNLFATTLAHYNSMLQPAQAKSDIMQWLDFVEKTHPDLAYTTKDVALFYKQINQFKESINAPISVRNFWLEMMVFNSVISDGHVSLTPFNKEELTKDYLQNGGTLFPFNVIFDNDQLIIKEELNGEPSSLVGNTIKKINGISINTILEPLLKRTHGDSDNQRKAVLATRFAIYYWLYFGEHKQFTLDVKKGEHDIKAITVKASDDIAYGDKSFESNFQFSLLNKNTGLLTINTFLWLEDEARVFDFFKSAFTEIKKQNLTHLVIDIRKNSGGDDHFWKKGILSYIADKPWRTGSNYKLKVIAGRVGEGRKEGDIVNSEISTIQQVEIDNPLKFSGDVSVLVGPYTYSSSILFMNTIQDYKFGKLVGDKTGGKSGQTGGIQSQTLTNSKLRAVVPRFWLTRPKGGHNLELVTLDTTINYDPMQPTQLIDKLLIEHDSTH